ncbi:hypothetical protein AVEN_123504-1 [Araneus ventricosus]|uniref:Uncharacterized protein n=1 Tax=Araneus ventricosus TaxID=182803 RepID=A0A4Y2GSD4_ARAVE|nr:hypothetical protein AVEN_123504-1 [Araneus ventricosus]
MMTSAAALLFAANIKRDGTLFLMGTLLTGRKPYNMKTARLTDRLPLDGSCPKFDRNLQIMCKDHIPDFIPLALIVFRVHRQT